MIKYTKFFCESQVFFNIFFTVGKIKIYTVKYGEWLQCLPAFRKRVR